MLRHVLICNNPAVVAQHETWGLAIFVLHEYFKETAGSGSRWGPYLRSLRTRYLTTDVRKDLRGTLAAQLTRAWDKEADDFLWWSTGADGPCQATTKICIARPGERHGSDSRFNQHQLRWAYWVVRQNSVMVRQVRHLLLRLLAEMEVLRDLAGHSVRVRE